MNQWIREAEAYWLDPLYQNAARLFVGTFLPSHDQGHHLRVWSICKNLLQEISGFNQSLDPGLVEGLLVAAMFHDLGMSVNPGKDHGSLGKEMCEEFLQEHSLRRPKRYGELLEAIEKHDLKEGSVYAVFVSEKPPGILDILSIADDLDALGILGIYRYAEIYLHRMVPLQMLGLRILENARKRYWNLVQSCVNCPSVVRSYSRQYGLLVDFYNLYNQQLLVHRDPEEVFIGHLGIVNYIRMLGVEGKVRPEHFLQKLEPAHTGVTVQSYFNELKEKLEKASL